MTPAALSGPFDNDTALAYVLELAEAPGSYDPVEHRTMFTATDFDDLEFCQELYALIAVVAEAFDPRTPTRVPDSAAGVTRAIRRAGDIAVAQDAVACMNRMLNAPHAALWQHFDDGGLRVRRHARVLRARLHRACNR